MRPEGRLRENEYYKGRWWDTLLFAILDFEWQAQQQVRGILVKDEK
jgi:RimJ/RimL family protein N-acetyltransferase